MRGGLAESVRIWGAVPPGGGGALCTIFISLAAPDPGAARAVTLRRFVCVVRFGRMFVGAEKEKMLRGELYRADDEDLAADHRRCRALLDRLESLPVEAGDERLAIMRELLGGIGERSEIRAPFKCDYGYNIEVGSGVFVNYDCVFLDTGRISIGDGTEIGPAVQIYAADHPHDPELRREYYEFSRPVTVGRNVWVGGGAILCPGVSVGGDSIIGAGSVVVRDIPEGVVAVGSPCRPVKPVQDGASR